MSNFKAHLINVNTTIKEALTKLDKLAEDAILIVVDDNDRLISTLTDGDIRRGFLNGINLNDNIKKVMHESPKFFDSENHTLQQVIEFRENFYKIIPIINKNREIIDIINFREKKSFLPIDVVIMAGGRGERLRPMTLNTPKPMLKLNDKPIIEYNLDRLISYGIKNFWISVNYLSEQITQHFKDGSEKNININYVSEEKALGTLGSVSLISDFKNEVILIINSDILTNIDYENFLFEFLKSGADMGVVSIPYEVNIPYAVLETIDSNIVGLKEKPTYTYFSNGGIYLVKKHLIDSLEYNTFYNATDLIQNVIDQSKKVYAYRLNEYWLDIGNPIDFQKAERDIKVIKI